MPILLTYFDRLLGPKIYLNFPESLIDELNANLLNQIKSLLDTSNTGFFTHTFKSNVDKSSSELKTANWIFNLESLWARGRTEIAMISVIVPEEEPDYARYEKQLSRFVSKLVNTTEIFKAFYINKAPKGEKEKVEEKYLILKEEMERLCNIFSLRKIETTGHLFTFSDLTQIHTVSIPKDTIKKIREIASINNKQNCFTVIRARGESVKIDLIPVDTNRIFNLIVIFKEQMTIRIIQRISQVLTRHKNLINLVFTSGICQEVERCVYEAYLSLESKEENLNQIIEEIYNIPGIIEIDVKLIELKGITK
ncbi:MAG: hypothetical protein GF383_09175 [Candidatus Lokiarchaeota archaeon]|nr:hypothetical protein [Candidatus Lokiarchaeota archaeon]MBD3340663.1 hypothetical protein [Candidatus Lokiarchaeota archaeon]